MGGVDQPQGIAEEGHTEDFPHHVGAVRVEEIHAPPCTRRRETAQHEQPRRSTSMGLDSDIILHNGRIRLFIVRREILKGSILSTLYFKL